MTIQKRLNTLENTLNPKEQKSAWVAMIAVDGKVKVSHSKHDDIHLNNRKELQDFMKERDLDYFDVLIVDIVNAKGMPPKEL